MTAGSRMYHGDLGSACYVCEHVWQRDMQASRLHPCRLRLHRVGRGLCAGAMWIPTRFAFGNRRTNTRLSLVNALPVSVSSTPFCPTRTLLGSLDSSTGAGD